MKRAGFKEEALLKEEAIDLQGDPGDIVRLSILDREYRQLVEE